MNKNKIETQSKLRRSVFLIYFLGCCLWLAIWYFVGGYEFMSQNLLFWFPFLSCLFILISIISFWRVAISYEKYEVELRLIETVEKHAAHMVTAISTVLIIAAAISAIKGQALLPKEFILFESMAFICAVVGVLPLYWIPSQNVHWLVMLRHLKTVPFTYSISLFLAGLLVLLCWV